LLARSEIFLKQLNVNGSIITAIGGVIQRSLACSLQHGYGIVHAKDLIPAQLLLLVGA